jgi:hypothetical protein
VKPIVYDELGVSDNVLLDSMSTSFSVTSLRPRNRYSYRDVWFPKLNSDEKKEKPSLGPWESEGSSNVYGPLESVADEGKDGLTINTGALSMSPGSVRIFAKARSDNRLGDSSPIPAHSGTKASQKSPFAITASGSLNYVVPAAGSVSQQASLQNIKDDADFDEPPLVLPKQDSKFLMDMVRDRRGREKEKAMRQRVWSNTQAGTVAATATGGAGAGDGSGSVEAAEKTGYSSIEEILSSPVDTSRMLDGSLNNDIENQAFTSREANSKQSSYDNSKRRFTSTKHGV